MSEHVVAKVAELVSGSAMRVEVAGHRIAVVRIGERCFAVGDRCSHADVSLSEGEVHVDTCEIECWKHGSAFSLETGMPSTLPATQPVAVYPVRVVDGQVVVEVGS